METLAHRNVVNDDFNVLGNIHSHVTEAILPECVMVLLSNQHVSGDFAAIGTTLTQPRSVQDAPTLRKKERKFLTHKSNF